MLSGSNVDFRRRVVSDVGLRTQNQTTSGQSTTKLFKAIDDENLGDFKRALAEGANVNAFDEGYTPLMTIIMGGDDSPTNLKMMTLLLQHQNLNVNIQEAKELNTALHLAFRMENRSFVQMLLRHPELNPVIRNDYEDRYGREKVTLLKNILNKLGESRRKIFHILQKKYKKHKQENNY
ncbi:ankyrin repeat domain-containing protein [Wolbachia endosymbiont (group B) of Agrotis puta]|uniref:ankyrin repeat domain-containing protein n=1 Tax=Wolbachia endosymbiont (group B) of Agrotis puta TaxID=3066162 RepID=UPI00333F1217